VVRGLSFAPDGATLRSASYDGTVRVWDVNAALHSGRQLAFDATGYYGCESPDGATIAVAFADGGLRIYANGDGRELRRLAGQPDWINWLCFSADGTRLLSAGSNQLTLWDPGTGEQLAAFVEAKGIDCAVMTPDAGLAAAVSRDAKARLWDLTTGEVRWQVAFKRSQNGIALAPDGSALAIVGSDGAALHDPKDGSVLHALTGHAGRVRAVKFSSDGKLLATAGDDGTVRLWQPSDGALVGTVEAHDNGASCLDFSPDGTRLATGGGDDRLRLWDVPSRQQVLSLDVKDMYCLSWSTDGRRLWVMPLAKRGFCLDSVPRRLREVR
jgi:WD40 repeat protein